MPRRPVGMTIRLRPCRSLSILVKRSCQFSGATGLGFFWLILAWGLVCDTWSFAVDTWAEPYSLSRPRPEGALEIPIANNSKNLRVAKLGDANKGVRTAVVTGRPEDWWREAQQTNCATDGEKGPKLFGRPQTVRVGIVIRTEEDLQRLFELFKKSRPVEATLKFRKPKDAITSTFLIDLSSEKNGLVFGECYYRGDNNQCTVYGSITSQVSGEFFLMKKEKRNWTEQSSLLSCVIQRTVIKKEQVG